MKRVAVSLALGAMLAGCASGPTKLPAGAYHLTSLDASGTKVAGPIRIDIPFNDQSLTIGIACSNMRTARVVATKFESGDYVASFECATVQTK